MTTPDDQIRARIARLRGSTGARSARVPSPAKTMPAPGMKAVQVKHAQIMGASGRYAAEDASELVDTILAKGEVDDEDWLNLAHSLRTGQSSSIDAAATLLDVMGKERDDALREIARKAMPVPKGDGEIRMRFVNGMNQPVREFADGSWEFPRESYPIARL